MLEKRIHEKAVARFEEDIRSFVKILDGSELRNFQLKIEYEGKKTDISLAAFGNNWGIIRTENSTGWEEWLEENSNFYEMKEEIIKKYEKEETDKILGRLENIDYLWRES